MYSQKFQVFISSFTYYFNTLSTERNSSWLMYDWIKVLESRTSRVYYLALPSNTILSYFFLFFLIIDLYFLIPAVNAQIFNSTIEFVIPTVAATYDTKNRNWNTTSENRNKIKKFNSKSCKHLCEFHSLYYFIYLFFL